MFKQLFRNIHELLRPKYHQKIEYVVTAGNEPRSIETIANALEILGYPLVFSNKFFQTYDHQLGTTHVTHGPITNPGERPQVYLIYVEGHSETEVSQIIDYLGRIQIDYLN